MGTTPGWHADAAQPALWVLGYPDQALERSGAALTLAQELAHPFQPDVCAVRGSPASSVPPGEATDARAGGESDESVNRAGFASRLTLGTIVRAWALTQRGQGEEGIAPMRQGLAANLATGAEVGRPRQLAMLAEAYGRVGQTAEGLAVLAEALTAVLKTGERSHAAGCIG